MKNFKSLSDEHVVSLVKKNKQMYREIVRRYEDKLLRYSKYLTGDYDTAADAVQEAFIKAYVNLNSFNTKMKFSSWIYRITHNEAVNQIKKKKNKFSIEDFDIADEKNSVEEKLTTKEIAQMVNKCLGEMPVKYKTVLVLYYLEEKSYMEISDIMRLPVGTVGTLISRGKKILKSICLAKGGGNYV